MLEFFRKYQRYFFIIITVVIVISFSFFGTYSTLSNGSFRELIAFRSIDGSDVTRHELDEMVLFVGTDTTDKLLFGGVWGPNFLNDGVIKKDFLETGLGALLGAAYSQEIQSDLDSRVTKEKRYKLYTHPQAGFIGTEAAWKYFSPEMLTAFNQMRMSVDSTTQEALHSRTKLFLMERQFPAPLLRQVLHYQEKQYSWLQPDQNLDYTDLSLFGYHTLEDWYGPRFVRLVAEFIINGAIIAEQRGYQVSKAEALADLKRNAEISFQQNARNPNLGVANSQEYFYEQLRRLGMDQNIAAKVWRQVLLFRRLFQDLGSSVFVDPKTFGAIDSYALAFVEGELFRLPKDFRFDNYRNFQKFEVYLNAVSKRSEADKVNLSLPTTFLSTADVSQKFPELVEKRYLLNIAKIYKKNLESTIGIKQTWDWEVEDKGWKLLQKQFSEITDKKGATREERFAVLESLDDKERGRVDAFARNAIINEHPEWIEKALDNASIARVSVGLHENGSNAAFPGLQKGAQLIKLLDAAPLINEQNSELNTKAKEAAGSLAQFTEDQLTYYRIGVIERSDQPEVLSFATANQEGILDKLLDSQLEAHYIKIRDAHPTEFQIDEINWKPFNEVKDQVADYYFEKILKAIKSAYAKVIGPDAPKQMIAPFAATLRFFTYLEEQKQLFEKDPTAIAEMTQESSKNKIEKKSTSLIKQNLADQWKLERTPYQVTRSSTDGILDKTELFDLTENSWTKVNTPANGDLTFFYLKQKGVKNEAESSTQSPQSTVVKAKKLLSIDIQQKLMNQLLILLKEKNAISLEYLDQVVENEPVFVEQNTFEG